MRVTGRCAQVPMRIAARIAEAAGLQARWEPSQRGREVDCGWQTHRRRDPTDVRLPPRRALHVEAPSLGLEEELRLAIARAETLSGVPHRLKLRRVDRANVHVGALAPAHRRRRAGGCRGGARAAAPPARRRRILLLLSVDDEWPPPSARCRSRSRCRRRCSSSSRSTPSHSVASLSSLHLLHLHARCVNEVHSTGRSGHSYNVPLCVKGRLLGHSFLTGNHFCWYQLQYR